MYGRCPDLLHRSSLTTHKSVHQMLVIDRRYRFPMKSSFFVSTCSNNVVCLTHAGTPPWRFCVHCEKNKETISNSRRRIHVRFLLFFSLFLHAKKQMASVDLLGVELERVLAPSTWPSKAQSISADRPLRHACTFRPGDQATNTFLEI